MAQFHGIQIVAFDMYGTLVRNDQSSWAVGVADLVRDHGLSIDPARLHAEWSSRERQFRQTRTNMTDPPSSPPFRRYWEAWRDAWAGTFEALGLDADADAFADRGVADLARREPFADSAPGLDALGRRVRIAVLSNADDRFLDGVIASQGWAFELVLSSERAQAYKPDPRIFTTFCDLAGVAPEQVLYVGDSVYDDMHGAKLAGMRAAHIVRDQQTPGRTPSPEGMELLAPDLVIASLAELVPALAPA